MYLIFDSSALDKPKSYKAHYTDTFSWPRMIHLSWIVLDEQLKPIEDYDCMVKPHGFTLTNEIEKRHHISLEEAKTKGDPVVDILAQFNESIEKCTYVFAHNLAFNQGIVGAECIRNNIPFKLEYKDSYCLMQEGTYYCKIPSKTGGYKWPSLQEMHASLFNQKYSPSNNARADVIAASRCFIMLKKSGALEDIFDE